MPLRRSALLVACVLATPAPGQAPPAAGPDFARAAQLVIDQTNRFRQDQHRPPVAVNAQLMATAHDFAEWTARTDLYGHEADGLQPWDRAKKHGYDYCLVAENIAYVWRSAAFGTDELAKQFVDGWE